MKKTTQTKIAFYYFGVLGIVTGIVTIYFIFQAQHKLMLGAFPVWMISTCVFLYLSKKVERNEANEAAHEAIKAIAAEEAEREEYSNVRIAEYGGEHVLIDGNFYTVLRRTFSIILLAGTLFSCAKQKGDTVRYEPQEVLMPSYACPDTLIVMDAPKLSAAMQLVYDGTIDATDYSIDSILHQYCIDAYDYTNKFGSLPKSK